MIKLRALKEGENLLEIIPEIIEAFDKNPEEDVVQFTEGEESYEISRFDIKVYQTLSIPKLQEDYFYFLVLRYSCMQGDDPLVFSNHLEVSYLMTYEEAQNDYIAEIMSKTS